MPISDIVLVYSQGAYSPYDVLLHSSVVDINFLRGITENTSIFDAVVHNYGIHLSDSTVVSDILSRSVISNRNISEQTIISGLLIEGKNYLRTLVESTIIYDFTVEGRHYDKQIVDVLPAVGVVGFSYARERSVACYISNYQFMTATTVIKVRNGAVQIEY